MFRNGHRQHCQTVGKARSFTLGATQTRRLIPMTATAPSTHVPGPAEQMRTLLAGHIVAQCLHATALLGIADLIAEGRSAIGDLAKATGTHAPSLHRMMRTLASLGVLTETAEGEFGLTPVGDTLRSNSPIQFVTRLCSRHQTVSGQPVGALSIACAVDNRRSRRPTRGRCSSTSPNIRKPAQFLTAS